MPDNRFYVTTPIYYVNGKPHIGTTYTTVIADAICRFARFRGKDALLVTGSDEHSQNIADLAAAAGRTPLQFCDEIVPAFQQMWDAAAIQSYRFVRTSDPAHVTLVQRFWQHVYDKGDVYKGEYSGWYHTSDNRFLDESEVPEDPESHPRLKYLTEEAYYFRLSKYEQWLLEFHEANPTFVVPDFRRNEMLNRIKAGLKDICISRTSTDWGIRLPWDDQHVLYVWVDALLAYVTGSGFDIETYLRGMSVDRHSETATPLWESERSDLKSQPEGNYWPCDLHIMAVDIPWFHAVIFPAMLASFGAPLPKQMLVHGYWNFGGEKMSKSVGNVVDPFEAMDLVGIDGLRYFLLREVPLGSDGSFSHEALVNRFNYDLANDLGNLVHRTVSMLHQLFEGVVPEELAVGDLDDAIEAKRKATIAEVVEHYDALRFSEALQSIWALVGDANRYIDDRKPWELKKKPERRDEVSTVFNRLMQVIRTVLLLAYPVIPVGANKLWGVLGLHVRLEDAREDALLGRIEAGHHVGVSEPIWQRIDTKVLEGRAVAGEGETSTAKSVTTTSTQTESQESDSGSVSLTGDGAGSTESRITIDDFAKVQFLVGEVRSADKVENADKLLRLTVFDGTRERNVLAGIAQYYDPAELVGKQVVLVANLAPRKMRGMFSEGMLLAAGGDSGKLALVSPEKPVDPGSVVR
jgi:methionyl-tRNA synthetase